MLGSKRVPCESWQGCSLARCVSCCGFLAGRSTDSAVCLGLAGTGGTLVMKKQNHNSQGLSWAQFSHLQGSPEDENRCRTRGSCYEMRVKLMDGFYFELIETFQNSHFSQDFKWKFQMSPPHFTWSSVSSIPLTPCFLMLLTCKLSSFIESNILTSWQVLHMTSVWVGSRFCFHNCYCSHWDGNVAMRSSGLDACAAFSPSSLGNIQLGYSAGCSHQCPCRVSPGPTKASRWSALLLLLESGLDLCVA